MPNYQQGKIYSIRSRSRPELIYIGSTTQPLSKRMVGHRAPSSKCSSKEIVDVGDSYIELIENFPCADKYELCARENRHMRALECVNKQSAVDDCPHGRIQNACIECGGSQICEHQRQRKQCKDCGGSSICEHQRRRNACKECKGSQICEHQRRRDSCKECEGSHVCEHQRLRRKCKICSPIECDFCNVIIARGRFKSHLKTTKHKKNYVAEFKRVFDADMTLEEVPEF